MEDRRCPYLEMVGEPKIPRSYPSHRHRCGASEKNRIVAPKTQAFFCLTSQHQDCPLFAAGGKTSAQPEMPADSSKWPGLNAALIVLVLLASVVS